MNDTLLRILQSREDISDYLFHFTKGQKASEILRRIIEEKTLRDMSESGVICFTEAPVTMLFDMFEIFNGYKEPMYAPYGIAIKKDVLFNLGARPVIYGAPEDVQELSPKITWRFEEYAPNKKDFSWLREWRINCTEIKLKSEDCFIVTKQKTELEEFLFDETDVDEIKIDGCVADGQFWGTATGYCPRNFKGIALEDIHNVNKLSKNELDKILLEQSMADTIGVNLGGFIN